MRPIIPLILLTFTPAALAVGTSHWTHTSEADFKNGTFTHVVATNLGDLKLSRAVKTLLEQNAKVSAVYALVEAPDGTIYAGTGPQGVVMKIAGDKVTEALKLDDGTSVFSLALDGDGQLLIGTGGEKGRVLKLDVKSENAKPKELFSGEGVQYVWSIVRTNDGNLYAATGPEGQLFEIKNGGGYSMLLDTDENNLLSLISDGKDTLYLGSDPNGLVYRVNRKTKDVYIVHDAAESEVTTLALDKKGNLYAGTAEAMPQEGAEGEPAGATEQIGRPEGGTSGAPIPTPPTDEPKPPELPDPNPGEPDPIPKKMVIVAAPSTGSSTTTKKDGKDTASAKPQAEDDDDSEGRLPSSGPTEVSPTVTAPPTPPSSDETGKPREGGNAIYRIDPDGLVTEIFRQPVLVLSMIEQDGTLLVGTGSEGLIYEINPAAEETVVLAKVEPKQIMSLLPAKDGRILLGLANTGGIAAMTSGFASDGTYTSPVLDAEQVSRFGKLRLHGQLPAGSTLKVSTRSGNVSEPAERGWSKWSDPAPAAEFVPVAAPAARFLQYRLTFTSEDGKRTAVVDDVDVAYQQPNLPPDVKSVKIATKESTQQSSGASSTPAEARFQTITWEADDPNEDDLGYSLYFRRGSTGKWILIKDKLKEATYEWDTRSVADGRYEIRVVASDARANSIGSGKTASRVSDPLLVDNTPPVLGNLDARSGAGEVRIQADAIDRSTTLAAFAYTVDSSDEWQTVLPSDKIADGPEEKLDFSIKDLKPGPHQVTVRATDARGNQTMQTIPVTVDSPAADAGAAAK
jgi:WD40 repeat protein